MQNKTIQPHENTDTSLKNGTERQAALREREHAIAELILETCRRTLPKKIEEGTLRDVASILETASSLGRLATGLPVKHTEMISSEPLQASEFGADIDKIYGQLKEISLGSPEKKPDWRSGIPE